LWKNRNDGSSLEMFLGDESEFNNSKDTLLVNFSTLMCIRFYSEDYLLVPVLKELISMYPDLLIYNDEGLPVGVREAYYVYTKKDVEATKNDDYWALLGQKPLNSSLA